MEKILKEELAADEKILWQAKPENFETLDVTHKKNFIVKAALIIGVVALLCVLYLVFAANKGIEVKYGLIVIILALAVFASINGIFDAKKLKKVSYVITDKRLILVDEVCKSAEFNLFKEAEFRVDADGHTSLLCGKRALESKPFHWRMLTVGGPHIEVETGLCDSFVFYAIPEADKVKKILSDFLPL